VRQRYQITGTTRLGDFVRIFLDRQDPVREREDFDIFSLVGNFDRVQQKQQEKAVLMQQPDVITVPFDVWKKKQYKIGDFLWINVEEEKL